MYNVIKKTWSGYFLGDSLLSGVATYGGSLFSGFIRSHKVLTLLSGGHYYRRNLTVAPESSDVINTIEHICIGFFSIFENLNLSVFTSPLSQTCHSH